MYAANFRFLLRNRAVTLLSKSLFSFSKSTLFIILKSE